MANPFEELLNWLNPYREKAGEEYEKIRAKLIEIFARRGCLTPDELADETIDRVMRKLPEIVDSYSGDRRLYFYKVAKYIYLEHIKKPLPPRPPPVYIEPEGQEQRLVCLDGCLTQLSEEDHEFILQYFDGEKSDRIKRRKRMAESARVSSEALRMRAHRIKSVLKRCVLSCVGETQ